jgi:hypothetical protein
MAATYTTLVQTIAWAAGKNMLAQVNHTGSGKIMDVYRIWMIGRETTAVAGSSCLIELWQCSSVASYTGGAAQTFVKHDTLSAAAPATVIANAGTTTVLTKNSLIKRYLRYSEEILLTNLYPQTLMSNYLPLNVLQDSGYGDTNIQPLRFREGEGFVLFTPASGGGTYVGSTDIIVEFALV